MGKIAQFIILNFRKLLNISICVNMICIFICQPNLPDLLKYVIKAIALCVLFLFPIPFAKLNNFTGATYYFRNITIIKYVYLIMMIIMLVPVSLGIITAIIHSDIERAMLFSPVIVGLFAGARASVIFQNEVDDPRYI